MNKSVDDCIEDCIGILISKIENCTSSREQVFHEAKGQFEAARHRAKDECLKKILLSLHAEVTPPERDTSQAKIPVCASN